MVDDAGAQGEFSLNGGIGYVDLSALNDTLENLEVQGVEISAFTIIAETDGAEFDGSEEFEAGLGLDRLGEKLCQAKVFADRLLESTKPEIAQREPDLQGAEGAGEFH